MKKVHDIDAETFRKWLKEKQIRGATLQDVSGDQHGRPCFRHPNTGAPFVSMPNTEASRWKPNKKIDEGKTETKDVAKRQAADLKYIKKVAREISPDDGGGDRKAKKLSETAEIVSAALADKPASVVDKVAELLAAKAGQVVHDRYYASPASLDPEEGEDEEQAAEVGDGGDGAAADDGDSDGGEDNEEAE